MSTCSTVISTQEWSSSRLRRARPRVGARTRSSWYPMRPRGPARSAGAERSVLVHERERVRDPHLAAGLEDREHVDRFANLAARSLDDQLGVAREPHDDALAATEIDLHVARAVRDEPPARDVDIR